MFGKSSNPAIYNIIVTKYSIIEFGHVGM